MLLGGESERTTFRPREVNHADVLMRVCNAMDIEKARREESTRAGFGSWGPLTEQFHEPVHTYASFLLPVLASTTTYLLCMMPGEVPP